MLACSVQGARALAGTNNAGTRNWGSVLGTGTLGYGLPARAGLQRQNGRDFMLRAGEPSTPFTSQEKTVLVPIANGIEEMEAVIIIDVLRRAGAKVVVASCEETLEIVASRGVKLSADVPLAFVVASRFDLIVLPGGMPGAERLRDSPTLIDMLRRQRDAGGLMAAICASPVVVLHNQGLLAGTPPKRATAHPAFVSKLEDPTEVEKRVVVDGSLITSRGPGTAIEFALALVERLFGEHKMREVAAPMVVSPGLETSVHAAGHAVGKRA